MEYVKKAHSNEVSGQLNVRGDPSSAWRGRADQAEFHDKVDDPVIHHPHEEGELGDVVV